MEYDTSPNGRIVNKQHVDDGTAVLQNAIKHTFRRAKEAQTREQHEDHTITLRLLGLLRDGWSTGPHLLDVACGYAVGLSHARYLYKRTERAAFERRELLATIPDYDYSTEIMPDHDPADGRRHYGNRFRNGNGKLRWDIASSIKLIDSLCGSTKDLGKLPVDTQIANGPALNTNEDAPMTLARIEQLRKAGRSSWSESVRAKRKQRLAENVGKKLVDSVSDYLYGEVQGARNAFEQDSYILALHLMAAVRRGDPDPFLCASYAAYGSSFPIYVQRRADRQWLMHQELIHSLPQEEKSGHKLFVMASSRVSRTDPRETGETNPPSSPARERLGDRAIANRRQLAKIIPWPQSPGVGDIATG